MNATSIAIDCIVKADVGAIVVRDYPPRFRFFKYFELRLRRLSDPLHRMRKPGIGRVLDVIHMNRLPGKLVRERRDASVSHR
jgi:hypothetical protein